MYKVATHQITLTLIHKHKLTLRLHPTLQLTTLHLLSMKLILQI